MHSCLKVPTYLQSDISHLIDQFTVCLRISSCRSASLASSWCTILSERSNSSSIVELLLLFLPADDFYYFWRCNLQMSTVVCNWPPPSAANIMATTLDLYSTPYTQRKPIHPPQLTISAGPAVDRTYALLPSAWWMHVRQNIWSHGVKSGSAVNVMQIEHIRSLALAPSAVMRRVQLVHLPYLHRVGLHLQVSSRKCTMSLA